jgi:integrase
VCALRGKGLASATIEQALRSLIVLYKVLQSHGISLSERLRKETYLDSTECELIALACKLKSIEFITKSSQEEVANGPKLKRIVPLEKYRASMKPWHGENHVDASTASIRLAYIRAFLFWRINREILHAPSKIQMEMIALRDLIDRELKNKAPMVTGRANVSDRMGIDRESQEFLRKIVAPDNPINPWKNEFTRSRNQLVIHALLTLGIRRGELLGLRVGDFKPQTQEVLILRRPDDPHDPRLSEPNTKTRDRLLPLPDEFYRVVKSYILLRREIVRGSHDFLLVSNTGQPLSKSGLNLIFLQLNNVPNLPYVGPHILRHAFFENLAEELHLAGIGDTEITYYLRQQGGWSQASNSPYLYIKRFAQERASKAILSIQKKLLITSKTG